jgi:hypothetical protein
MTAFWDIALCSLVEVDRHSRGATSIIWVTASFYQTARCNIPEGCHLHTHCCENLKAQSFILYFSNQCIIDSTHILLIFVWIYMYLCVFYHNLRHCYEKMDLVLSGTKCILSLLFFWVVRLYGVGTYRFRGTYCHNLQPSLSKHLKTFWYLEKCYCFLWEWLFIHSIRF